MSQELVLAGHQVLGKNTFEPALFILIVQQDHGSNSQRMPAGPASRHFPLQILEETVGEVVLIGSAPRRLNPLLSAVRALVFQSVLLRIAAERRPACISNSNSFFRRKTHYFFYLAEIRNLAM